MNHAFNKTRRLKALVAMLLTTPLCSCGPNLARDVPAFPFEHDVGCLDTWSIVHTGSGFALGEVLGGDSFLATLALLTGYEIVEPSISTIVGVESTVNQQCDVAVGLLGWAASAFRD